MLPPVHTPVPARALTRAAAAVVARRDPRNALIALLKERYAADAVVLTASGTHALQLAIGIAVRASGRDAVALPAYSCYDVATAGAGAAARLEFYDIEADTLAPDRPSLRSAIERGVAAVVVVHPFGLPMDLGWLQRELEGTGVRVIEDAAQAHGGSQEGRVLGSLAPASVLSFGRGKGWTGGSGGALLLRGGEARAVAADLTLAGPPGGAPLLVKLAAQSALGRPALYGVPAALPWLGLGETHYAAPTRPRAMAPAAAAAVLASDRASLRAAAVRRDVAVMLRARLGTVEGVWLPPAPGPRGVAGYLRLPVRRPGERAEVAVQRLRRLGVLPSYPVPLSLLPQVQDRVGTHAPAPGAETLARELFTAPVHGWVDTRTIDRIAAMLAGRA